VDLNGHETGVLFAGIVFRGLTQKELAVPVHGLKLIFPVNAELILMAEKNPEFRGVLSRHTSTFDGFWPYLLASLKFRTKVQKISGSEFVHSLFERAAREHMRIFFLGATPKVNQAAREAVQRQYGIELAGYSPDFESYPYSEKTNATILQEVRRAQPQVLLVAFGAPKQELWLDTHIQELEKMGIRLAMGVGGTLDMLAGVYKKAPRFISFLGLEGIWRVLLDPKRIKRFPNPFRFFRVALHS